MTTFKEFLNEAVLREATDLIDIMQDMLNDFAERYDLQVYSRVDFKRNEYEFDFDFGDGNVLSKMSDSDDEDDPVAAKLRARSGKIKEQLDKKINQSIEVSIEVIQKLRNQRAGLTKVMLMRPHTKQDDGEYSGGFNKNIPINRPVTKEDFSDLKENTEKLGQYSVVLKFEML